MKCYSNFYSMQSTHVCFLMLIDTVEHMFEVIIEGVSGLKLSDNMIWGEADCFVQYHFPAQTATAGRASGATVACGMSLLLLLQLVIVCSNVMTLVMCCYYLACSPGRRDLTLSGVSEQLTDIVELGLLGWQSITLTMKLWLLLWADPVLWRKTSRLCSPIPKRCQIVDGIP